jgi:hypothetical protein
MKKKRILVCSDPHAGHRAGLTPPRFWSTACDEVDRQKYRDMQERNWVWFEREVRRHGPYDAAIWLGDVVNGGNKHRGKFRSELIVADLNQQIRMGVEILCVPDTENIYMVFGTDAHVMTPAGIELERHISRDKDLSDKRVVLKDQLWFSAKGSPYVIDCRHACASNSYVETSAANPLIKERITNRGWWMEGVQPLADIYLRGHSHRMFRVGEPNRWEAFTVPPLQDLGSKLGRTSGIVVHPPGIGVLTINGEEWPRWKVYEMKRQMEKIQLLN